MVDFWAISGRFGGFLAETKVQGPGIWPSPRLWRAGRDQERGETADSCAGKQEVGGGILAGSGSRVLGAGARREWNSMR